MPADEVKRKKLGPQTLRVSSGKIFTPIELAERIHNFARTEENTLKSCSGIIPYCPRLPDIFGDEFSDELYEFQLKEIQIQAQYEEDAFDVKTFQQREDGDYVPIHGVFHARIHNNQRDILLVQRGNKILVHKGYTHSWRVLVGPEVVNEIYMEGSLETTPYDSPKVRFPTQFVATPTGVVIVPQGESDPGAYFYDGEVILPLGYQKPPGPPTIIGPNSQGAAGKDWMTNKNGYSVRKATRERDSSDDEKAHLLFGAGQIGTVINQPDGDHSKGSGGGRLLASVGHCAAGAWQVAVQWVDYWGNLSPISSRSAAQHLDYRSADWSSGSPEEPRSLQHSFHISDIPIGPKGTMGRNLFRTKDTKNAGTVALYAYPSASISGSGEVELSDFATIAENISTDYPDNYPDSALAAQPKNIVAVPKFKLCELSFGRLWIANFRSFPGKIRYSMPGMWGTFEFGSELVPDASGEITGLKAAKGGLLVFTKNSTYLVRPNSDNSGFTSATVDKQVGCSAPSSIQTMPDGSVIWLGSNYFYKFDGESLAPISEEIQHETRRINRARAAQACSAIDESRFEYLCWVAVDESSTNNLCFVYDGQGWKTRNGENFQAACRTMDHRNYILGAGRPDGEFLGYEETLSWQAPPISGGGNADNDANPDGSANPDNPPPVTNSSDATFTAKLPHTETIFPDVWVVDHEWIDFEIHRDHPFIETSWINGLQEERSTPLTVKIWMRETSTQEKIEVDIYRDWRKNKVVDTVELDLHSNTDAPATWGSDEGSDDLHTFLNTKGSYISKRRPYWVRKDIFIPSCKAFKLVFKRPLEHPMSKPVAAFTEAGLPEVNKNSTTDVNREGVRVSNKSRRSPIEFIAFSVEEASRPSGMRMNRPKKG